MKNLKPMIDEINQVFEKHLGTKVAMAICFTMPPEWNTCHWVANIERTDTIRLLESTAEKIKMKSN